VRPWELKPEKETTMEAWLRCEISPGQFSSEYAVRGRTADGIGFSLFVPNTYVEMDSEPNTDRLVQGWVRVEALGRDGSLVLVRLPRPTLENGETVTVKAEEVETRRVSESA
jgi:hypothetical protein